MKLNLKNPIVFFDLETTGTSINVDRIVEICYLKVHPNGNEEAKTLRINPEMHIPEGASAVHGIYDKDVADCPTFKEVARTIANDIEGCDLAGFNSNRFDIPVLAEEFLRADVDIDLSRRKFVDALPCLYIRTVCIILICYRILLMPRVMRTTVRRLMKYILIFQMINGMILQMIFPFRYITTKQIIKKEACCSLHCLRFLEVLPHIF